MMMMIYICICLYLCAVFCAATDFSVNKDLYNDYKRVIGDDDCSDSSLKAPNSKFAAMARSRMMTHEAKSSLEK